MYRDNSQNILKPQFTNARNKLERLSIANLPSQGCLRVRPEAYPGMVYLNGHLRHLKVVIFHHRCLLCGAPLKIAYFFGEQRTLPDLNYSVLKIRPFFAVYIA
jgi:hypothetical protein